MTIPSNLARSGAADDCRDLLTEDGSTIGLQLPVSCNISENFRDLEGIAEKVTWTRENIAPDKFEWRISITGCDLESVSHSVAKQCIARSSHRGVMFIGDSITRYQYLNLTHFLATGAWHSPADLPNENENEKAFGDWARFLAERNHCLEGCEIYRNGSDFASVVENRYFEDPAGAKLSFHMVHGEQPFRQHALRRLNVTCNR
jgi:hypothetical protein